MQFLRIQTFFASYLGSHCNEVPLKRSFLFNGPKKLVPLSESPTYPESQLSGVFLVKFSKEVQGTKENGLSYPGSHLTGVYCNNKYMIASTPITNTKIFAFMAGLGFRFLN